MQTLKSLAIGALAISAVAAAGLGGVYMALRLNPAAQTAATAASAPRFVLLEQDKIQGKAAALYDLSTGVLLYQKNAQEPLPLASITKLMSIETVLSYESTSTTVTITADDLKPEGDWGLRPGQTFSLGDLVRFALVASSNDAMQAAAMSLGSGAIDLINEKAASMGFASMRFSNPTGLDVSTSTGQAGAYGSAYDVARLGAAFYKDHPDLFELTTHADVRVEDGGSNLSAEATAAPLFSSPGFAAAKTGYTDLAGGNLVAVFDLEPGRTVVGAVLSSTRDGRFSDMQTLIDAARKSLQP